MPEKISAEAILEALRAKKRQRSLTSSGEAELTVRLHGTRVLLHFREVPSTIDLPDTVSRGEQA